MSGNSQNVYVRLKVEDAQTATNALRAFGDGGSRALQRIERATIPATAGLKNLDRASGAAIGGLRRMGNVAAVIDGPLGGVASRFTGISGLMSTTGVAVGALALAVGGLTFGLKAAISSGSDYEKSMFRIGALLNTTALSSGRTSRQINELSIAIGKNTLASTGEVRAAAAQLLTFKSIAGETFDKTLTLSQDLAALGFGSISSSAVQLAKALEDPERGLTSLRRIGVSFTAAQEKLIKGFVESGEKAKAQTAILAILEGQVGGAGTGEAAGLAGAYDTLSENVGIFLERAGTTGPVAAATSAIRSLGDAVDSVTKSWFPTPEEQLASFEAQRAAIENDKKAWQERAAAGGAAAGIAKQAVAHAEAQIVALDAQASAIRAVVDAHKDEERAATDAAAAAKREEAAGIASQQWDKANTDYLKYLQKQKDEEAKALEAAAKKEADARVRAREAGLDEVGRIEDRWQKASLTKIQWLAREEKKELAALDASYVAGVLTREEKDKAASETALYYAKQTAEEREKLDEKTFGRQARKVVDDYFDELSNSGKRAGQFVVDAFGSVEDALAQFFLTGKFSARDFFDAIKVSLARLAAQDIVSSIGGALGIGGGGSAIGGLLGGIGSFVGSVFGFREGGRIEGPGTATSDSILLKASAGEYIVNARATAQYLPLLEEINRAGRFAHGGRVGVDGLPRFWSGGSIGSDYGFGDWDIDPSTGYGGDQPSYGFGDWDIDPRTGLGGDRPEWTDPSDYGISPNGPWDVIAPNGDVIDRIGGTFWDRVSTFFGGGTTHGFFGSKGAGALTSLIGRFAGGPFGFIGSTLVTGLLDFFREKETGGSAINTGLGGVAYGLASGKMSLTDVGRAIVEPFRSAVDTATLSLGLSRGGGLGGFGDLTTFGDTDTQDWATTALTTSAADRASLYQTAGAAGLSGLRERWGSDYMPVRQAGARVLAALRDGGAYPTSDDFIVGEAGAEVARVYRPGHIVPNDRVAAPSLDTSGLSSRLDQVIALLSDLLSANISNGRQVAALAAASGTLSAVRKTARG